MTPLLAFLDQGGTARQVCIGCSQILHEQGMVEIVEERPLHVCNAEAGTFSSIVYRIVPPFTLDECRAAIGARHTGPAWGS